MVEGVGDPVCDVVVSRGIISRGHWQGSKSGMNGLVISVIFSTECMGVVKHSVPVMGSVKYVCVFNQIHSYT